MLEVSDLGVVPCNFSGSCFVGVGEIFDFVKPGVHGLAPVWPRCPAGRAGFE